ncbi:hypothetical protein CLV51_102178 [Chitinophaga niastensis]|uniref:Uncharacterized protein n=1 Tax=Chitinophaga niastensis TaxID=536980 RepID=A0A2P8HM90_CHINA|nr:hypothetical protein [Chitinophaga niastensis]PSL47332.1 hypothetical protein CLV51_102178 [Chitinophaga niastensis]
MNLRLLSIIGIIAILIMPCDGVKKTPAAGIALTGTWRLVVTA